ncbi:MAG: FeoB-associated Cys-rich membrane protein [Candidatus Krumholzibacteriota bacterium]|nr:FeoB-associated Cys-rich membrane protein [Candidatus Krumholzibacteriota bacterium]
MGPFNMPWLTFWAFIVVAASIAGAVLWAVKDIRDDKKNG